MRDFNIADIPSRTGYDIRRDRERMMQRIKTAVGWVGLSLTMMGIGALVALTTFPR